MHFHGIIEYKNATSDKKNNQYIANIFLTAGSIQSAFEKIHFKAYWFKPEGEEKPLEISSIHIKLLSDRKIPAELSFITKTNTSIVHMY